MGHPQGLEVYMKNGLLRFYLLFMFMSLALFSCENHEISNHRGTTENAIQRKPESRHPVEPNEAPEEAQKSNKRPRRNYNARSSNWC
jgi:hypothetical protein